MSYSVEAYYRHEHGDAPVVVHTPEQMDELIAALLNEPFDNSEAALYVRERPANERGYPDHEFRIAVDSEDKVGGLRYMGGGGTYFSKGALSKHEEISYCHMGSAHDYPRDSEISLDAVRQAAREFLTSGGERPTNVEWQDAWAFESEAPRSAEQ